MDQIPEIGRIDGSAVLTSPLFAASVYPSVGFIIEVQEVENKVGVWAAHLVVP
jgi:hypothetical protein